MLFSDNSQARIRFQPQVERSVTANLRMSHFFEPIARADNLDYGAKSFRVCHTPRRQSVAAGLPQYEEFIQCGPRDERPENGRLAPPEWAEIFLADRQNSAQNK
jgi:hypothetical protein